MKLLLLVAALMCATLGAPAFAQTGGGSQWVPGDSRSLLPDATRVEIRRGDRADARIDPRTDPRFQHYHYQRPSGSSCSVAAQGGCNECAIQCAEGRSATCVPGRSMQVGSTFTCTGQPMCMCR